MRLIPILAGILLVAVCSCDGGSHSVGLEVLELDGRRFVRPSGAPAFVAVHEVTRQDWAAWVQAENPEARTVPGLVRDSLGKWAPERDTGRLPAAHLNQAEARAYCEWFSRRHGVTARLPSEAEWEQAARGGLAGTRFSWGWEPPRGRARFDSDGPAPVGSLTANRLGLHDTCGNVWEWCEEPGVARGGAWSERAEAWVSVAARAVLGGDYRGADAGFRLWIEPSKRP